MSTEAKRALVAEPRDASRIPIVDRLVEEFKGLHLEVITAQTLVEAFPLIEQTLSLVVTALHFGTPSNPAGIQIAKVAQDRGVPVIFFTGCPQGLDKEEVGQKSAAILDKMGGLKPLVEAVRKILVKRAANVP